MGTDIVSYRLAILTTIFYLSLALTSGYYFLKFRRIQINNSQKNTVPTLLGRYDEPKVLFFFVLMVAACFDMPMYIDCSIRQGPVDCQWDEIDFGIFWFLHLIAICGYVYAIITPCVLWNDIINKKDGNLFFSNFPVDNIKRFFQGSFLAYLLNTLVDIVVGMAYYKVHDPSYYSYHNIADAICSTIEPILIFLISVGCLASGIKLQSYVMKARIGFFKELRFLFHLNVTMIIIVVTYLTRAILVLRLVSFMPSSYENFLHTPFFIWLLFTRWLPYIFCSFCLIMAMRLSGEEVAARCEKVTTGVTGGKYMQRDFHLSNEGDEQRLWLPDDTSQTASEQWEESLLSSSVISDLPNNSRDSMNIHYANEHFYFPRSITNTIFGHSSSPPPYDGEVHNTILKESL